MHIDVISAKYLAFGCTNRVLPIPSGIADLVQVVYIFVSVNDSPHNRLGGPGNKNQVSERGSVRLSEWFCPASVETRCSSRFSLRSNSRMTVATAGSDTTEPVIARCTTMRTKSDTFRAPKLVYMARVAAYSRSERRILITRDLRCSFFKHHSPALKLSGARPPAV